MSELAKKLIAENKISKDTFLDLGNCGLTTLPAELLELTHLESLILGTYYFDEKQNYIETKNQGKGNQFNGKALIKLAELPALKNLLLGGNQKPLISDADISFLSSLVHLTTLNLSLNEISDISFLSSLANLISLDLSSNQISDISYLSPLANLISLDLSSNQISDISYLSPLANLTSLDLSYNQISNFLPLSSLANLITLSLRKNQISDMSFLSPLTNLTILHLSQNEISDISPLSSLVNLISLNLWINEISDISPLSSLVNLTELYLGENQISDISALSPLANLTILDLVINQISDISALSSLANLAELNLSSNQISDISHLSSLVNLTELVLWQNQISDISHLLSLVNLTELYLGENQIQEIDYSFLSNFPNLYILTLFGNPINNIPLELLNKNQYYRNCLPDLKDYFQSIANKDFQKEFNEAKLIIVGVGEVGKSELVEALSEPDYTFVEGRETTLGIRIKNWTLKDCQKQEKSIDFQVNVWDFAGQEINYGTHQFFLTKNSVYVFVWETRKGEEESKFAYWLSIVSLLSENAPVFVVQNKTDIYTSEINQADWKSKFPNIVEFYKTSCKSSDGIEKLRTDIQRELLALPHTFEIWNKDRYAIRENLEQSTENYISHKEYLKICAEKSLTTEQAGFLSKQLHDIGAILHYLNDFDLKKTVVLKPEWATQAAYCLLLDNQHVTNGKFSTKDLENIWAEEKFDEKHTFLLGLMKKFELVFQFQESEIYILPERLPIEQPKYQTFQKFDTLQKHLRFEYHYDFMPKGLMSRFICRMHELIKGELFWKYGVILQYQSAEAIIISSEVEKQICIEVYGNEADKLLAMIRRDFESIHEKLKNPKLTEKVPCVCDFCKTQSKPHFFDYSLLLEYQNENLPEIRCGIKVKNQVPISALLEGILDTKKVNRELLLELIDENEIPKFYQELDRLGVSSHEISRLQKEFIHNGSNFEYADKLKVWVRQYFREGRA